MQDNIEPSVAPIFQPLKGISTITATDGKKMLDNVRINTARDLTRLVKMPEFKIYKGDNSSIALIGGGPSLKKTIEKAKEFSVAIACGSSNDFVVNSGIVPTYTVVCDPDPVTIKYLTKLNKTTKYLIASCCDPSLFEHLKDYDVYLWHCHSEEQAAYLKTVETPYEAVCGGCTVGLRSQSIAILFGYRNLHYFGFDSCLSEEDHHAYEFATEEEKQQIGVVHEIKIGHERPNEKVYKALGYQMAQAAHYKEFYQEFNAYFNPTFHGEGLLPDLMRLVQNRSLDLEKELAA